MFRSFARPTATSPLATVSIRFPIRDVSHFVTPLPISFPMPASVDRATLATVGRSLDQNQVKLSDVVSSYLRSSRNDDAKHREDLLHTLPTIYSDALRESNVTAQQRQGLTEFIFDYSTQRMVDEVKNLSKREAGLHINAKKVELEDIDKLNLEYFEGRIRETAPRTWRTVHSLLTASTRDDRRKARLADFVDAATVASQALEEEDEFDDIAIDYEVDEELEALLNSSPVGPTVNCEQETPAAPSQDSAGSEKVRKRWKQSVLAAYRNEVLSTVVSTLVEFVRLCASVNASAEDDHDYLYVHE